MFVLLSVCVQLTKGVRIGNRPAHRRIRLLDGGAGIEIRLRRGQAICGEPMFVCFVGMLCQPDSGYTYLVMLLAIIFVLGAGWSFFIATRPEVGFFLEEGWKFRDAEPSDLYLGVTRFGAAVTGIALLVFAAIFAFGGPGDTASRTTEPEPVDTSRTGSGPPVVVTAKPRDPEQEAKEKAKEQCDDLLPSIEEQAVWDPNGKLINQDHISGIATSNLADMTIASRPEGDIVTIRSGLPYVDEFVRPIVSMTSSGATCVADRSD